MPHATTSPAPAKRRIRLNGEEAQTFAVTLADLLREKGFADVKVATAINGSFVAARARTTQALSDGDEIEVVSARQGG